MQSPVQVQFKNMESSEALEAAINKWVDTLDRAYPAIITCRVGMEVRFVEHEDNEVPGASSVRLIGKHHIA